MDKSADYRACVQPGARWAWCLSRNRSIVDCNQQLCEMFGASRELLIGQSFQVLYPSADEYERLGARMAPILNARGYYADDRIMKRV
jgi:PAS domain S-box-containing protein